jgi:hypothetical protein
MSYSGVKLPEFDTLVARHTAAATQMQELAARLHQELAGAGLDTTPAERIRKLAAQVAQEAEDLRKRQSIVREMERNKIAFGASTAAGSFITVPDSLREAQGQLDGTLAAKAAKAAAAGDKNALKQLQAYAAKAQDPSFAKTFLRQLGAKGMTQVSAAIAAQLRADAAGGNAGASAKEAREAMRLLATTLAKGTNPKDPAYMGDGFLDELVNHGRTEFKVDGTTYFGYQAQALIWRAGEGKPPFSEKFMQVVGRDAIVFEKEKFQDRWAASKDAIGSALGSRQVPMADLATVLGVAEWMIPSTPSMGPAKQPVSQSPHRGGSAVIDDLFHAASSNAKSAQALLNHTPAGWKQSVLSYMLTDRLGAFHFHGNTDPFAEALRKATTGKDSVSLSLTTEALNTLKVHADKVFRPDDNDRLTIADRKLYDELSFLRRPVGSALASHIDQVYGTYITKSEGFDGLSKAELDRLLVLVSSDRDAAVELQAAEAARVVDRVNDHYPTSGDKGIKEQLIPEAKVFGHLVEARRLALLANAWDEEQTKKDVKDTLNSAFALFTSPIGGLGTKVAGELGGLVGGKGAEVAFDKLSAYIVNRMIQTSVTSGEALRTAADQNEMVDWLMQSAVISARIATGEWSEEAMRDAKGSTYVTDDQPPKLKPIHEIMADPKTFDDFMEWARRHSAIESTSNELANTVRTARDKTHDNLNITGY